MQGIEEGDRVEHAVVERQGLADAQHIALVAGRRLRARRGDLTGTWLDPDHMSALAGQKAHQGAVAAADVGDAGARHGQVAAQDGGVLEALHGRSIVRPKAGPQERRHFLLTRREISCARRAPHMQDPDMQDTDFAEIRRAVQGLCAGFPGTYWQELDQAKAYPEAFVRALTESGFLAALIPEEFGGSGLPLAAAAAILEEIQKSGCNAAACHAQMYTMGTLLRHGSPRPRKSAGCRRSPPGACGSRPSASPSRPAARIPCRSRPRRGATASAMSSTARRSGPAGPSTRT